MNTKNSKNLIHKHTALYSDLDIRYQQEYSGPYIDLSWASNRGISIAAEKDGKITGFGRPVVIFGSNLFQKVAIRKLYNTYDDIVYCDYLVDGNVSCVTKYLLDKGYEAIPYMTQVIDLTKSESELKKGCRKSYKQFCRDYPIEDDNILRFKNLHLEVVGYPTRSDETWALQEVMIDKGEAKLMMHPYEDVGILCYTVGDYAYYASAKSKGSRMHSLMWHSILWAKSKGCKYFEMGEQVFGDSKAANISVFKRGFGGETKARLIVRKKNENINS